MRFDLNTLEKALLSFNEAIQCTEYPCPRTRLNPAQWRTMRAGVIHNFELCYELGWQSIRQYLVLQEGEAAINTLGRKALFELAEQKQVIQNADVWYLFHQSRNEITLTYDELKADEIYQYALEFFYEAQALVHRLKLFQVSSSN